MTMQNPTYVMYGPKALPILSYCWKCFRPLDNIDNIGRALPERPGAGLRLQLLFLVGLTKVSHVFGPKAA